MSHVARAHTDDDSIETEMDSVHGGLNGTVTSKPVGPDGTINSFSQIFSSYTDCLPVSCKNRFWTYYAKVYPVNCGNKPRVWTHVTALLELEAI